MENLEVTIRNVHIRYEDDTSGNGISGASGFDFAAGFTLKELKLSTKDLNSKGNKVRANIASAKFHHLLSTSL